MGLIAREIEAAGIPTIVLGSAFDITDAVAPPRGVFLHYPLGHTAGPPGDPSTQQAIVRSALRAGFSAKHGEIVRLPFAWEQEPGWEERAYMPEHTATGPDGKPLRG